MKKIQKILSLTLTLILLLSGFGGIGYAEDKEEVINLTILGTSDIHSNLYGYAYEDQTETKNNGLSRVSTYVKEIRANNPNTILIDNGDTFQGTILADAVYNKKPDVLHPVSKAFNFMKYDAMVLGNHEFNFGMNFVEKIIDELEMPVLAANARYRDGRDLADLARDLLDGWHVLRVKAPEQWQSRIVERQNVD